MKLLHHMVKLFNHLNNSQKYSPNFLSHFTFPPATYKGSNLSTHLPTPVIVSEYSPLRGQERYPLWLLNSFPSSNFIYFQRKYWPFIYLWKMVSCMFASLFNCVLLWSSYISILYTHLVDLSTANTFSHSVVCILSLSVASFIGKNLSISKPNISPFYFFQILYSISTGSYLVLDQEHLLLFFPLPRFCNFSCYIHVCGSLIIFLS